MAENAKEPDTQTKQERDDTFYEHIRLNLDSILARLPPIRLKLFISPTKSPPEKRK